MSKRAPHPIFRVGLGLAALSLVSYAERASAQANFDGVMLGGRTAMMGGAAVAKGSDGATAFINPAGLTRIPGQSFSFQTVAVQSTLRTIDTQLDPSGKLGIEDPSSSQISVSVLPNTFCLFLDGPPRDNYSGRSRHKYGLCAADVERENFFYNTNGLGAAGSGLRTASSQANQLDFARSALAGAWGFELMPGTSIGVSARIENTRLEDQLTGTAQASVGGVGELQTVSAAKIGSSWDAAITLGVTHAVSRVVTLGASLTTPAQHFLGFYRASETFAPATGQAHTLVQDNGDFRYNQPASLRLGLAFSWPTLQIEVNANFYSPQEILAQAKYDRWSTSLLGSTLESQTLTRGVSTERGTPVTNFAVGVEKFVEADYSIIFGALTDFSGLAPRVGTKASDALFRQRKDAIHAAFGVASYRAGGSILLGFRGYYAVGDLLTANPAASNSDLVSLKQTDFGLSFVVSGQISFEAVRDTAARAAKPFAKIPDFIETEPEEKAPPVNPPAPDGKP